MKIYSSTIILLVLLAIIGLAAYGAIKPAASQQPTIEFVTSQGNSLRVYRYIDELGQRTDFVVYVDSYRHGVALGILREWK